MEKKQTENKKQKTPILVHPVGLAMHVAKTKKMEHDHKKNVEYRENLEETRQKTADFVEQKTNGEIKSSSLLSDFNKIDQIRALKGQELSPIRAKIAKILNGKKLNDKTLTKEQKEQIAPLLTQSAVISRRYSVQELVSVSLAAVKLYDEQGKIKPDKKGAISGKSAAIIVGALGAAGVAGYAVMSGMLGGNGGKTSGKDAMEASDYAGSLVNSYNVQANANQSYAGNVDPTTPEFQAMIKSTDYQQNILNIQAAGQAQVNSLKTSTDQQILDTYKAIDLACQNSGYKEDSILASVNDVSRVLNTNGEPLESRVAFLVRCKEFYESKNMDGIYERFNGEFSRRLPQSVQDVYNDFGVTIDYTKDAEIRQYLSWNVSYQNGHYVFDEENLPEGVSKEFVEAYFPVYNQEGTNIGNLVADIQSSQDYKDYINLETNIRKNNEALDECFDKMDQQYVNQIKGYINNIDTLQANYDQQIAEIQENTNQQIATLQQTTLGLDTQTNALGSQADMVLGADYAPTGDKQDLIHSIIDSVSGALKGVKEGAEDAITTVVDEITRSF